MHFNTFRVLVEVVEHHSGNIANDNALVNVEIEKIVPSGTIDTIDSDKIASLKAISRNKTLAVAFIKRLNRDRYGVLIDDLENHFSRGNGQYPIDLLTTLNTIDCYVGVPSH